METSLPVVCGCSSGKLSLTLFTKCNDDPYPTIEVAPATATFHNIFDLSPSDLPKKGYFILEDGVVSFGIIDQRRSIARYFSDMEERLTEWCHRANEFLLLTTPKRTA